MKFSLASAFLVLSAFASAAHIAAPELSASEQPGSLDKRYSNNYSRNKNKSSRYRGRRSAYYRYGRYWVWDNSCDSEFIVSLRYRPRNYYGQRFQYLYLYIPDFRNSWNSSPSFRRRWDSQPTFYQTWFARVQYTTWTTIQCNDACSPTPAIGGNNNYGIRSSGATGYSSNSAPPSNSYSQNQNY